MQQEESAKQIQAVTNGWKVRKEVKPPPPPEPKFDKRAFLEGLREEINEEHPEPPVILAPNIRLSSHHLFGQCIDRILRLP